MPLRFLAAPKQTKEPWGFGRSTRHLEVAAVQTFRAGASSHLHRLPKKRSSRYGQVVPRRTSKRYTAEEKGSGVVSEFLLILMPLLADEGVTASRCLFFRW
jgi:hypothetical protein